MQDAPLGLVLVLVSVGCVAMGQCRCPAGEGYGSEFPNREDGARCACGTHFESARRFDVFLAACKRDQRAPDVFRKSEQDVPTGSVLVHVPIGLSRSAGFQIDIILSSPGIAETVVHMIRVWYAF